MAVRRKVYDVLPTITYRVETWTTTKLIQHKLCTTQRAMERQMLLISIRYRLHRNTKENWIQRYHQNNKTS